jgi:hypothetical protein
MPRIRSYQDWIKALSAEGKIFDENNREIPFYDFVKMVLEKQSGNFGEKPNLNHYDYCQKQGYNMSDDWKDDEGYSFTSKDFS